MKFKVGDIIFSDYYEKWGFVSKMDTSRFKRTKRIYIRWFIDENEVEYIIGSLSYKSFIKKSEDNK